MFMGYNRWDLGMDKPEAVEKVKEEIKEEKKIIKKEKTKIKKTEREKEKEKENLVKEEENKKLQKEEKAAGREVKCAAISKGGNRCRTKIVPGKSYCTIHEKVEQNIMGGKSQCKKMKRVTKTRTERCGMMTANKSGYCYYHD
jgi:vacuolar-type H+-ATPase subunit I/STV1